MRTDELVNRIRADRKRRRIYDKVSQTLARRYLGNIHHICTNEVRTTGGAVVWTDHGPVHAEKVLDNVAKLLELDSVKAARLDDDDYLTVACAAWLHDIGMFVRHPSFPDLTLQRKYHGRVARCILAQLQEDRISQPFLNRIAEVCELHQAKTQSMGFADPKTMLLGNVLMLADALHIGRERVAEGRTIFDLIKRATRISETSAAEWWVNDCVSSMEIAVNAGSCLQVTFAVLGEDINRLCSRAEMHAPTESAKEALVRQFRDHVIRYLEHDHLKKMEERGPIIVKRLVVKSTLDGKEILGVANPVPYRAMKELWAEQFSEYKISGSKVGKALGAIRKGCRATSAYLFVFDHLDGAIRYLVSADLVKANGIVRKKAVAAITKGLSDTKIPYKCGIVGSVAYSGVPLVVDCLDVDPRRCFKETDDVLGLHSVMLYPLVDADKYLWGIALVNRSKDDANAGGSLFGVGDLPKLKCVIDREQKGIVDVLKSHSTPYVSN